VLIHDAQIDLIETSFETIKKNKASFSTAFYEHLFEQHPQLQPLFSHTTPEKQGGKLYAALVLLVENLRHPAELERVLVPLGEKHVGYGATPEAYPMVSAAILWTLEQFLGEAWTDELRLAWNKTLDQVTHSMLRGAGVTSPARLAQPQPLVDDAGIAVPASQPVSASTSSVDLVERSFARIKADKEAFTDAFYPMLFAENPQLKPLFGGVDMKKQGAKLNATLGLLVQNLRHPDELERVLLPLGKKHVGYGARPEHYPMVCSAILKTLENTLGDDWTPPVAAAWRETFAHVQSVMLRGAEQEAPSELSAHSAVTSAVEQREASPRATLAGDERSSAEVRAKASLSTRFADWFYSTSLSTIIGIWALIGVTLVSLSFIFPSIRGVVLFANPLSLLLALFLFLRETPERKKQFHYHAWSTIDHAAQLRTSNARFLALQDLCADGVSLKGLSLDGADLIGIELEGADIASATLRECNLASASLSGADLNNVDLNKATLSGARLAGANLGFANLSETNCSSADLSGANLLFADLSNANLSGVNLSGAKLSGANFSGTYLSGANLRGADVRIEDMQDAFVVGATMPDGSVSS